MNKNVKGIILKIAIPVVLVGGAFALEHIFNAKAEEFTSSVKIISEDDFLKILEKSN